MNKSKPEIAKWKFQDTGFGLGKNILLPIILILIMVSLVSTLQDYFVFFKGIHSPSNFLRYFLSKSIYFFYFIPLVMLLYFYSKKFFLNKKNLWSWLTIHTITIISTLYLHQLISFTADKIIFTEAYKSTFYMLLYTNPSVWGDLIIYILFLLGISLIDSQKKSRENKIAYSNLEMELTRTKLFELRSKIHPRFLFNTLDTISRLIKQNQNREANKVLSKLGDFLRTTVYDSKREEIPLKEEIAFLNQYLEIEKINFVSKINFTTDIDETTLLSLVPNFILQPIVENLLYQHEYHQDSEIKLAIITKKTIENTLIEIEFYHIIFSAKKFELSSTAIDFVVDQLKQLYEDQYSIQLYSETDNKILIKIILPFHQEFSDSEIVFVEEEQA